MPSGAALLVLFQYIIQTSPPVPTPLDPESLAAAGPLGRNLIIEVYEPQGTTALGIVPDVIEANTEELLSGIGAFSIIVPKTAHNTDLMIQSRELAIIFEDEGEVFRGIIEQIDDLVGDEGTLLQCTGPGIEQELTYENTYRGIILEEEDYDDSIDIVLQDTGWIKLLTGAGYIPLSRRYDNMTKYEVLLDLSAIEGAYLRPTDTLREIEFKNSHSQSGIRLVNVDMATPELLDNPAVGLINTIHVTSEGNNIYNRVVPEASESDVIFNLGFSDRTTPYVINELIKARPSVTDTFSTAIITTTAVEYEVGSIEAFGRNRGLLIWLSLNTNDVSNTVGPARITANGRSMFFLGTTQVGAGATQRKLTLWGLHNPDQGRNTITIKYGSSFLPIADVEIYIVIAALQDIDLAVPVSDISMGTGNSTVASTNVNTLQGDMVIAGFAIREDAEALTTSGETVFDEIAHPYNFSVIIEDPAIPIDSPVKVFAAPTDFLVGAVSVRPAKVYYIEDGDSVAAYRRRAKILQLGEYRITTALGATFTANSMYDKAVDYLTKHKDPVSFYDCDIGYLPGTARDWWVGDTFQVIYNDPSISLFVDAELICVKRNATYNSDGVRNWKLDLSTVARRREQVEDDFFTAIQRINAIQNNQV